jgi:hypothetical protein
MKPGDQARGQFDPATKAYAESGSFSCPMTVIDHDALSHVMYSPRMEISYKRVK